MAKTLRKLDSCPNCELSLDGESKYCAACGQENTTKNVSLRLLFRDILDDYFTLDSRFLSSMKPFLTKPGFLTNEFNVGRRVKFMPPLRMYIVFSLIYFVIPRVDDPKPSSDDQARIAHEVSDSMVVQMGALDSSLSTHTSQLTFGTDTLGNQNMNINISNFNKERATDPLYRDSVIQGLADEWELDSGSVTRTIAVKAMDNMLSLLADDGKQFIKSVYQNIPKMMFILLPLFALLIKLFYFRLKPLYVETIIFSLHFHSFAFLVFAVNGLLRVFGVLDDLFETLAALIIAVYLVLSLRAVFKQKYGVTILKFFTLGFTYSILVLCALGTTFALTLYLYK